MPKILQNEICRADTKKTGSQSTTTRNAKPSATKTSPVSPKRKTSKSAATTVVVAPIDNDKKPKNAKKTVNCGVIAKTKKIAKMKDKISVKTTAIADGMKNSNKSAGAAKCKDATTIKKQLSGAALSAFVKKKAKAESGEAENIKQSTSVIPVVPSATSNTKETKKRKEPSEKPKKKIETGDVTTKKTPGKGGEQKSKDLAKWLQDSKKIDESRMAPKKRIKHKCAKESLANNEHDGFTVIEMKKEETPKPKINESSKKVKFFKSKARRTDKTKETTSTNIISKDLKEALAVYDNIDEDSEGSAKTLKKQPKSKLTLLRPSPKKSKPSKNEKRKLESDSDVERVVKRKKVKKNVINNEEDEENDPKETKIAAKSNSKPSKTKMDEDSSSTSATCSDNAPLNRLVASKKLKQDGDCSSQSEISVKSKATSPKTSHKTDKGKKSVRFSKQTIVKEIKPAVTRTRGQRMASLNAMAMVHCMYENESKNIVSSFESAENSDTNVDSTTTTRIKSEGNEPELNVPSTSIKIESNTEADPVINRESLRSAPGLRSVGKHWDMNSSSASSQLSDGEIVPAAKLLTAAPIPNLISSPPVVIEEVPCVDDKRQIKNAIIKKKFPRSLCRHVSDDSSEEDKHQALLLKEKQRMIRRRRKQRKEMTMDLKDMVVCKRMASLNATAILAASYSSATGKRTITVKSAAAASTASSTAAKSEEKSDTNEETVMSKIKSRKLPQLMRKKFSSSSDADVEDEADLSGNEMVQVKTTASSSGKQQVSLIVNQDSGVTITGLYLNSTTKSTHHQGYCSISGMQYRISSSHAQTEATTVTTEPIVRNPQEPMRPSISLHPDRQMSPPSRNMPHTSPVKSYTPLGALSNMQPPGSPHHVHHLRHHPKTMTISSTQEISSLERHGCPSAFSAPAVYVPPPPPTVVPSRQPYPIISKTPPEAGFVTGYYQPAGPLISHHHHHHHHHHVVQSNSSSTNTSTSAAGMPPTTAAPATTTVPATASSSLTFAKVSQSPLAQPPTPPASNITQQISETSDNDMASATTPAAEITVSESATEETNYPINYRLGNAATANTPFRSPSSHNSYQTYYPSPPSTASLSHPQPQQAHFQEVLYSANPPPSGGGPYHHLGFLQPKAGVPYYHHHAALQRRYIPALPPQPQHQYFHHEYSPANALTSQQSVMVPAHPLASTSDVYHSAPPTPSIIETYPPPPPPPPPPYYTGYNSAPPTPYYPYATSSRSLTLVETSCPCPLQGCQKNVDTGPLTGFISKGPVVEQRSTPLSPVALSLPREPHDIRSLPSPARGSAGSRPTPSPAIATAKNPSSLWTETGSDYGYDTAGLLTISSGSSNSSVVSSERVSMASMPLTPTAMIATAIDSAVELDSGVSEDAIVIKTAGKNLRNRTDRREKTTRTRKMKSSRHQRAAITTVPSSPPLEIDEYPRYLEPMTVTNESSGQQNRCRCHLRRKQEGNDDDDDDTQDTNLSDLELPPKLYPEVGPDFEKRRSQKEENETDEMSSPPLAKRFRRESLRDDDVQKNNYLSALQLKSVNGRCDESKESTINQAPQVTASTFANAVRESAVPFGRHSSMKVGAKSRAKDTSQESVESLHSKHCTTTELTSNALSSTATTECCLPTNVPAGFLEPKKARFRCRRRWTTKKKKASRKNTKLLKSVNEEEKQEAENAEKRRRDELLSLSLKRASCRLKWSNGWMWSGEPFVAKVFLNTEGPEVLRTCYHGMKHEGGDTIRPKDCILLKSGNKKTDLPYVAKVAHLWEDPEEGEMMMSLFWYYRPEHTEHDNVSIESPSELYASKHKDVNSVACIEDKCYVLTFNEYCRYHKSIKQNAESVDISSIIVPPLARKRYPRQAFLPPENTSQDLVFFCRKIYDFRQHRLLKNPFFV